MTCAVEFDFVRKIHREVALDQCRAALQAGHVLWLDVDVVDPNQAMDEVRRAFDVPPEVLTLVGAGLREARCEVTPEYLLLSLPTAAPAAREIATGWIDVVLAQKWVATIRRGQGAFIHQVRSQYHQDFQRFAQSPSFMLYEVLEAVLDGYRDVAKHFDARVESVQTSLMREGNPDETFADVSHLQLEVLRLRKDMTPLREALAKLAMRKNPFVSEATQPFLGAFSEAVERILGDLAEDRDLLADSLNLYMSVVGHRTNRAMNRLTVVSTIFLPLTFVCGVYGMNFIIPEYRWPLGYVYFWSLATVIVVGSLLWMRRLRIL